MQNTETTDRTEIRSFRHTSGIHVAKVLLCDYKPQSTPQVVAYENPRKIFWSLILQKRAERRPVYPGLSEANLRTAPV